MAYFRVITTQLAQINSLLNKEESWLILINADPDALGAAMALQRIMRKKTKLVHIARINEISRPDNLAMIRNLRIPVKAYHPEMLEQYNKFALVDSQPHHSPVFAPIAFSIIIDHHPHPISNMQAVVSKDALNTKESLMRVQEKIPQKLLSSLAPTVALSIAHAKREKSFYEGDEDIKEQDLSSIEAVMHDIRPDYGATCTMLTEYLYHANIRPGKCLATAMQYGIRTDTGMFGRQSTEVDIRAYHFLSRFADSNMLMRIIRSEYLPQWLPYFTRAFECFKPCGLGHFTYLSEVDSPDILVVIADFFLRVHGLKYIVVTGIYQKRIICIFRGSDVNLGLLAQNAFLEYGSAGGHKSMARAEISLAELRKIKKDMNFNLRKKKLSLEENKEIESFLSARLKQFGTRKILKEK